MEKAMPWIIGILAILLLCAFISVGWLYSILTIVIVAALLFGVYNLIKLSNGNNAYDSIARATVTAVSVICIILIFVGGIIGLVGLANMETVGYKAQTCGYCGGFGTLSDGSECGLCDGAGGAVFEEREPVPMTWVGILVAVSAGVVFVGMRIFKEMLDEKPPAPAKSAAPKPDNGVRITTSVADLHIRLGHFQNGDTKGPWFANRAAPSGGWTVRCDVKYIGPKQATKLLLEITPYHDQLTLWESKKVAVTATYTPGTSYTLHWKELWPGEPVNNVKVSLVQFQFSDGTNLTIKR